MQKPTMPFPEDPARLSVERLAVEVVEGTAAGTRVEADEDTLHVGSADGNDLVLDDPTVSRFHLELLRGPAGILLRDHGSTNGTFVGDLQVREAVLPLGTQVRCGRTEFRVLESGQGAVDVQAGIALGDLRGSTAAMRRLFAQIRKAASSAVPVLLVGESGTGKELMARALHDGSPRADGPFVVVDCASLTPTLVASELFGHEKGAFTGADQRHEGAFERAHGGTIFLDELGELPEALQPNLLGVLERRKFRRLGGRKEIDVDVRVVCATNRDLRSEVNAGRFRLDLYYRVAVVRLSVPPLRERVEDIPLLVERFLQQAGVDGPRENHLPASELARLARHHWPGNVRELRNYVEARVAMGEAPPLDLDAPGDSVIPPPATGPQIPLSPLLDLPYKQARGEVLRAFEEAYLPYILERAGGNVSQASRDCAMDRSHLWDLLRRHRLR